MVFFLFKKPLIVDKDLMITKSSNIYGYFLQHRLLYFNNLLAIRLQLQPEIKTKKLLFNRIF